MTAAIKKKKDTYKLMETGKQPVKAASIVKFNYVFQWNKNLQLPPPHLLLYPLRQND